MQADTYYPWQATQWQRLQQAWMAQRLPHALLLTGLKGLGKTDFARSFSALLLCQHPENDKACGRCEACLQRIAGHHPNFHLLSPEGASQTIKIDMVRALIQRLLKTAQGYRIALIEDAHAMNIASQNALLKTLEEPGEKTVLILVSDQPHLLLPTIRSRCQAVNFSLDDTEIAKTWLSEQLPDEKQLDVFLTLANGAPLAALAIAQDEGLSQYKTWKQHLLGLLTGEMTPVTAASGFGKTDPKTILSWLMQVFYLAATDEAHWLRQYYTAAQLHILFEKIIEAQRLVLKGVNVNAALLLENLMIIFKDTLPC